MIHYLNPDNHYTDRKYLMQWFLKDTLVITDGDLISLDRTHELLLNHPIKNRAVDVTHNPVNEDRIIFNITPVLTNNCKYWYHPTSTRVFFPLFLWMYSMRNSLWWPPFSFDAGHNKTQEIMCLNFQPREHRAWLWEEFARKNIIKRMMYTFPGKRSLPNEPTGPTSNDVGIDHPIYNEYAVNIVTETTVDQMYISEKTCKAFIARQIPVIVGAAGINQFLHDIKLDMFDDIVPWRTWDNETDTTVRLQKIADFVEQWLTSGTILSDYRQVLSRVEHNKQYFHSEDFRNRIMNQMQKEFA